MIMNVTNKLDIVFDLQMYPYIKWKLTFVFYYPAVMNRRIDSRTSKLTKEAVKASSGKNSSSGYK
jgi:hypothetical protein